MGAASSAMTAISSRLLKNPTVFGNSIGTVCCRSKMPSLNASGMGIRGVALEGLDAFNVKPTNPVTAKAIPEAMNTGRIMHPSTSHVADDYNAGRRPEVTTADRIFTGGEKLRRRSPPPGPNRKPPADFLWAHRASGEAARCGASPPPAVDPPRDELCAVALEGPIS